VLPDDLLLLVRNRSKEIVELLSDVEKIRAERRKAKTNKSKYTGVSSEGWGPSSTGTRYGGFGSESFSSGGGGNYGGGGGGSYGGGNYDADDDGNYSGNGGRSGGDGGYSGGSYSGGSYSGSNNKRFQEYDAGDDETPRRSSLSTNESRPSNSQHKGKSALSKHTTAPIKAPEKPPAQEVDLLGFADDDAFGSGSALPPPVVSAPALAPPQPVQPAASLDGMLSLLSSFQALANVHLQMMILTTSKLHLPLPQTKVSLLTQRNPSYRFNLLSSSNQFSLFNPSNNPTSSVQG